MKTYTAKELSSPANSALLEEIVLLIALSFADDPVHRWMFSGHSRESCVKNLPSYVRIIMRLALLSDASTTIITQNEIPPPNRTSGTESTQSTTSESQPRVVLPLKASVRAVGVTIPPHGNATFDSTIAAIRAGALTLPLSCGLLLTWKLVSQCIPRMQKMHDDMFPCPKHRMSKVGLPARSTKHDNWHLFYLATHPENQGQGCGTMILQETQETVRAFNKNSDMFALYPLYLEASSINSKRLYNRVGFKDRTTMTYGELNGEENLNVGENNRILGGRMFGMVWYP